MFRGTPCISSRKLGFIEILLYSGEHYITFKRILTGKIALSPLLQGIQILATEIMKEFDRINHLKLLIQSHLFTRMWR